MHIPFLETAAAALSTVVSLSSRLQKPILSHGQFHDSLSFKAEIPGGSPFSLCQVSRPTDLFEITSVQLSKQPIYIDDVFMVHLYGTFHESFTSNATLDVTGDCGSHCKEYGAPADSPGETWTADFCEMSEIEQPLGGKKALCPPQEGYALINSMGYVFDIFVHTPMWYNFTFDAKTAEGKRIYCLTTEVCLRWEDEDKNKHFPPGRWNNCSWPR